jgi:hypothetical protein
MIYDIFMSCWKLSRRDGVLNDSLLGEVVVDEDVVFSSSKSKALTKR